MDQFGELLHESWMLKRGLSDVSLPAIDAAYDAGLKAGAAGGKLLGAGQGGFLLFIAKPEYHDCIQESLPDMLPLKVNTNAPGSRVIFAQGVDADRILRIGWPREEQLYGGLSSEVQAAFNTRLRDRAGILLTHYPLTSPNWQ